MKRKDPLADFVSANKVFVYVFGALAFLVTILILRAKSLPDESPSEPRNFEEHLMQERNAEAKKHVQRKDEFRGR